MNSQYTTSQKGHELLKPLEEELLAQSNGCSVHWCRRGTTAGAWAFKAAALFHPEISAPEVILPSTACSTIPAAGILAGCKLKFVDVSLDNALPSVDSIMGVVNNKTVAVLFIHMFGNTSDLAEFHSKLSARGIWLIEDVAQAFGGHMPSGAELGSVGEMTLHGFTDFKILESGGGALVVRDSVCENYVQEAVRALYRPEPMERELYSRYDRSFQAIYNGIVEFTRLNLSQSDPKMTSWGSPFVDAFESVINAYRDWFLQADPPTIRLSFERRQLETAIDHRLNIARLYREILPEELGEPINDFELSGNCWRYTILLNEPFQQENVISRLRRRGFAATDLYWPLDTILSGVATCPNALELGRRVVNLSVDKTVNEEMVREMGRILTI